MSSIPAIDKLREKALADYASGRRGSVLIEWAFVHAAAKAQAAIAEHELRVLEEQLRDVRLRMVMSNPDALGALNSAAAAIHGAPTPYEITGARGQLAQAIEFVAAAETMLALLAKAPKPASAAQKATPLPRSVPAVAPGARFGAGGKR